MSPAQTALMWLVSLGAGLVGAAVGLGGGVIIVPMLVLWLDVDVHQAAGTSLVCVLATSAAGSVALDRSRLADPRLVANLGLATVLGGTVGGLAAPHVSPRVVYALFGAVTAWAAYRLIGRALQPAPPAVTVDASATTPPPDPAPTPLGLGMTACVGAGLASGLLGIGGAPVQVPVMTELMGVRPSVAFATSNVMVGITAAASTAAYFSHGLIRADLVAPCAIASAIGAFLGGRLAPRLPVRQLVIVFVVILVYLTGRMLWKAASP